MRSNFSFEKYDGNEVKCSKRFPSELYKLLLIVEIKLQALLSTAEESLRKKAWYRFKTPKFGPYFY